MSQTVTLLDKQSEAIEKLSKYKVGALFMDMGTGKTRAAYNLVESANCEYILWLTPFQTKKNLREELSLCGDLQIEIVGIETLSSSDRTYLELINKLQNKKSFIIVDESLKIKNFGAKRTRRIIELGKLAEFKLILNGTPLSRNLLDLWAQMEFLSPKILKMDLRRFYRTFCEYMVMKKHSEYFMIRREWIVKYHNVDYLYSLIGHFVYECDLKLETKRQYLTLNYEIDEPTKKEYTRLKEKYLDNEILQLLNNNIFLEMTQKMQHLYSCTLTKFELVNKILDINDPHKTLIYCKYIDSAKACERLYKNSRVLTYGQHSYGLNLQDYNVIIFFDKTFDYAQRLQSEHRIFRTGQQETCYYYDLTGDVGLENMIDSNISKKTNLLDEFKRQGMEAIKKI